MMQCFKRYFWAQLEELVKNRNGIDHIEYNFAWNKVPGSASGVMIEKIDLSVKICCTIVKEMA